MDGTMVWLDCGGVFLFLIHEKRWERDDYPPPPPKKNSAEQG